MKTGWVFAVLVMVAGCKKKDGGEVQPGKPGDMLAVAPPPAVGFGGPEPFAALKADAAKAMEKGWKEFRSKKWADAQASFRQVITLAPDHAPARWALVRALVAGGAFTEVPAAVEPLYQRDYAGWPEQLEKSNEFKTLRMAPEWEKLTALKNRYRAAHAAGLDKGFIFVTHVRSDKREAFHYDPDAARFRRLTETGGKLFAILRSPDKKQLVYLAAPQIAREGGPEAFVDPKVGVIDLATLENWGPFTNKGRFDQVMLATNASGQPIFTFVVSTGASVTYTVDTARTGLAKLEGDAVLPSAGETRAWPSQVTHIQSKTVEGVKITDGANQFSIDGVPTPITAARPIAQSSLDWSPGKKKLTYAGKIDACKAKKTPGEAEKNELYVYDLDKKAAQRVSAAVSLFETLWLDDDRLVYEGGVGQKGQLHIYGFTAHADSALRTRNGAGLYGIPTLSCDQAETGVDESLGETEAEGD